MNLVRRVICILLIMCILINSSEITNVRASQKYMTVGQFLSEIDAAIGPVEIETKLSKTKKVTLGDAAVLAVKAEIAAGGKKIPDKVVRKLLESRVVFKGKLSTARKKYIAQAYAMGLIKGSSCGAYQDVRCFKANAKCTLTSCRGIISRLKNADKRYCLSPEYKLLRTNTAGMPVLAEMYEYVLEDYPNEYYDSMFNFMTAQAVPGNALQNGLWKQRNCDVYIKKMTWDSAFSKMTYEDRVKFLINYDSSDRLGVYSAYILPGEYDEFAHKINQDSGYLGLPLNAKAKRAMADIAAEYTKKVLNIDYRTIESDSEWRTTMRDNGISEEVIDAYIANCIKDELVIECDCTAADIAAIYYDRTPFTFKNSNGVVRTYAHYRIVNDNGKAFDDGNLVIGNGVGRQCLRNTRISSDGLSYEWVPTIDWQNGYFDIGVDMDGNVNAAVFDVVRYKGVYIAAFGYPCETQCYYPGTLTVDGILATRMKSMTKEKYLAEWGYLY